MSCKLNSFPHPNTQRTHTSVPQKQTETYSPTPTLNTLYLLHNVNFCNPVDAIGAIFVSIFCTLNEYSLCHIAVTHTSTVTGDKLAICVFRKSPEWLSGPFYIDTVI